MDFLDISKQVLDLINNDIQSNTKFNTFNNWNNEEVIQSEFKNENLNYIQSNLYKGSLTYKGTKNHIKYVSKINQVDIAIIDSKEEIQYEEIQSYFIPNNNIKYDKLINFNPYTYHNSCNLDYEVKIDIDKTDIIIDYTKIINSIKLLFDENLYACNYFRDIYPYLYTKDFYNDKLNTTNNEKLKINHIEKHYNTYGETGYYGQKIEGRAFYYGDNWSFKPKFEIKTKKDRNDEYEVYYTNNTYYYSDKLTDKKKKYDIRYYYQRRDESSIIPTPKIKDDYYKEGKVDEYNKITVKHNLAIDVNYRFYGEGTYFNNKKNELYTIMPKDNQDILISRKATMYYGHKSNTFNYYNSVWDRLHNKVLHPKYMLNGSYLCYNAYYDNKYPIQEKNCLWDNFEYKDYYQKINFYGKDKDVKLYNENMETDKFIYSYSNKQISVDNLLYNKDKNKNLKYNQLNYTYRKNNKDKYNINISKNIKDRLFIYDSTLTYNKKYDNELIKYFAKMKDSKIDFDIGVKDRIFYLYKPNNKLTFNKDLLYNNYNAIDTQKFIIKRNIELKYRPNSRVKYYNSVWEIYDNIVLHPYYNRYTRGISYIFEYNKDMTTNLIQEKELLKNKFDFIDGNYTYNSNGYDNVEYYTNDIKIERKDLFTTKFVDYFEDINFDGSINYGNEVTFRYKTQDKQIINYNTKLQDEYNDNLDEKDIFIDNRNYKDYYNISYNGKIKYNKENTYINYEEDKIDNDYLSKSDLVFRKNNIFRYTKNKIYRNTYEVEVKFSYNRLKIKNNELLEKSKIQKYNTNDIFLNSYNDNLIYNKNNKIYINNYKDKQNNIIKRNINDKYFNLFDGTNKFNSKLRFVKYYNSFSKIKATIKIDHDKEYKDYYIIKDNSYYDLAPFINEENKNHNEDYYIRIAYEDYE